MPVCMYPLMIIVAIVWFGQPAVRLLHTAGLPIYLPNPHLLVYTNAYYTVCGIRIWIDIWILCACVCMCMCVLQYLFDTRSVQLIAFRVEFNTPV